MNMDISTKVKQVYELTRYSLDESEIINVGSELLQSLRTLWNAHRQSFSREDIERLKDCGLAIKSLKDFCIEKEDFDYLRTKEDVDDVIEGLHDIIERLHGCAITGKISKDIRILISNRNTLPHSKDRDIDARLKSARLALQSNAPTCKKCGRMMILREGNGSYFWGCNDFPNCWGKKFLTGKEYELIEAARRTS
ncbi:topoisomerase DNA-binding C4 zinc finger domain-containing protein [Vibrio mediterranei]|uniref:topoisomerase DNA-binding C4 zinc finger domain-containing protein n=1 Tax=Vibrio mediterranei TaxID=689 RepID=UPI00148DD98E|nr:topoisomerase DNA-binding C4 zinc finger domain-containing protein [Vibrio mediterranei]NOI26856.1 hypothetical protein [Vibrio mediterranei]